jgi:hypothetical protein
VKTKVTINVVEKSQLKWPDGWERTPIGNRQKQGGWRRTFRQYRDLLVKELERLGVSDVLITFNPSPSDRQDPGVAVYFSKPMAEDYSWQLALGIDSPAPTLEEIEAAFKRRAKTCHPDVGGDVEIYKRLTEHRARARAWVLGTHNAEHEYAIPCDRFEETRLNLAGVRLAVSALRNLERVGVPGLLERSFRGLKTALPAHESEVEHATTVA